MLFSHFVLKPKYKETSVGTLTIRDGKHESNLIARKSGNGWDLDI